MVPHKVLTLTLLYLLFSSHFSSLKVNLPSSTSFNERVHPVFS